jgi:hypothetical protein
MDPARIGRVPSVSASIALPSGKPSKKTPRERIHEALELGRKFRLLQQRAKRGRAAAIPTR